VKASNDCEVLEKYNVTVLLTEDRKHFIPLLDDKNNRFSSLPTSPMATQLE
jgi:hypothetical protein